jgi:very-short-patch-repair endonuclease
MKESDGTRATYAMRQPMLKKSYGSTCAAKLVIELDGGRHVDQRAYDNERTRKLETAIG